MADVYEEKCLGEISAFLDQSAREMEAILHKLDWEKEKILEADNLKLVHCPVNHSHTVPSASLEKHINDCKFRSQGLKPQADCDNPDFFYETSKAVISVFVENFTAEEGQTSEKVQDKGMEDDANCLDEIRSIMSWDIIPSSHQNLQLSVLPQEKIKQWIMGNLPQVQYLSSVEGACDRLVNFVLCCLKEEKVSHPGGMEQMLMDFLGDETQLFILNLWKFLAVSIAKENFQARVEQARKRISLPMDRVISEFTPQQRLSMYEHVIQVSNAKREVKKQELEVELESKSNDTTGGDGQGQPKSRYELLAEQRDYKRRRQSYRAKNVHITKRSAVEVMRDLIETQMNVLETQLKEERGESGHNSNEEDTLSFEGKESRDSRTEYRDSTIGGRERRDEGRKKFREGHKRVRYYDDAENENKKSRR
ncbi:U11/U12 small nuclear ribonucleoprotein 48 kDa protein-like [Montipora foliosa]|uniref:U11/U12 small nuclear ribonucleoprotein 48 kDa protein-like n=1 Tax=Montipora foliosa TaxID=591990 RepID=UPI0035F18881